MRTRVCLPLLLLATTALYAGNLYRMPRNRETTWQSRLRDDRKSSLQQIKESSNRSLIERLLEVQEYSSVSLRSFDWAHTATCLRVARSSKRKTDNGSKLNLQETTVDILRPDSTYIAVSYCNRVSTSEPKTNKKYQILRKGLQKPEPSEVGAHVLDRVINFSRRHDIADFWIDDDCLGQTNRMEALNGMDMVYRQAAKCVGLLSVTLSTEPDAQLLDRFLQGRFMEFQGEHRKPILNSQIKPGQVRKLCDLLRRIFSDGWWTRCWTFQEAYCGGNKMMLLMPHRIESPPFRHFRRLKYLGHDIELCLRGLQQQTTLLSLAMSQVHQQYPRVRWSTLKRKLERGRRYATINEHETTTRRARFSKTPMSASIVADVCRRDLYEKADLPAVVANCCDYTRRIYVPLRVQERLSLSLVILALFLLNGDFLKVNSKTKSHSAKTV